MVSSGELSRPWSERIGVPESFADAARLVDPATLPGGEAWGLLMAQAREWLDVLTTADPPPELARRIGEMLATWTRELREHAVPEREQPWGHRADLPARGQVMAPDIEVERRTDDELIGTVTFGRFHLGGHDAVHGGAVALFFDEVLGRLSNTDGRPAGRTVSLKVAFRAVTPVGRPLRARAWFEGEEGRKRVLRGEIRDGATLCAEASALFVALYAHQG